MNPNQQYEQDAKDFRKAMKGLGTDERAIIKIVGNRSNYQRQQIKVFYKTCFGRDLVDDLKDELSGDFEKVVVGMFMTPIEYDAHELYKAMKGAGTDEETLIEIIGSRPNGHLAEIKRVFKEKYSKDLEKEIMDETSGRLKKLFVALLQCNRSENCYPDQQQALADAQELYDAGEGKWGTDESVFTRILTIRSPAELYACCVQYQGLAGKSIIDSIEDEFSGDEKELLKTIVLAAINPAQYFATRIRKATKGWGTDDSLLIRILVSRDEIDLPQIKIAFKQMYGIDLLEEIKDETSGDYKDMLLELASH